MKKLLVAILTGLSLIGLVGCGEAPITPESINTKLDQCIEISNKDAEIQKQYDWAKENNRQFEGVNEFTDDELNTVEYQKFLNLSKAEISVMDNDELKKTNAIVDAVLMMATDDCKEQLIIPYSVSTRDTMIKAYTQPNIIINEMHRIVNELETYKMNVNEFIEVGVPDNWKMIGVMLPESDQSFKEIVDTIEEYNKIYIFDDEYLQIMEELQTSFHNFAEQYPKEAYPRTEDSLTLQQARKSFNQAYDKLMMFDIRQAEGVVAP
ncbi:hypothetical protein ACSW9H_06890 [Clostridium perfringens]